MFNMSLWQLSWAYLVDGSILFTESLPLSTARLGLWALGTPVRWEVCWCSQTLRCWGFLGSPGPRPRRHPYSPSWSPLVSWAVAAGQDMFSTGHITFHFLGKCEGFHLSWQKNLGRCMLSISHPSVLHIGFLNNWTNTCCYWCFSIRRGRKRDRVGAGLSHGSPPHPAPNQG